MTEILSGNYRIIESGMGMTTDESSDLELKFNIYNKLQFRLIVSFSPDLEEKQIKIESNPAEGTIKIIFHDNRSFISYGLKKILEIGAVDGIKIYIRIWVTRMGDAEGAKKIEYNLYERL